MSKIRTLHLFDYYLPLSANWIFSLMNNIPEAEIVIGAESFLGTKFCSSEYEYIRFSIPGYPPGRRDFWARAVRKIRKPLFRKLYPGQVQAQAGKIDIVHSHFGNVGWQFMNVAESLSAPHVVSFYGYDYLRIPNMDPAWRARYNQLFQQADCFISEGEHAAKLLEKIGCPKEKIRICKLGVDVEFIPLHKKYKKENELKLLQLATFREKKGHKYTIEAFMSVLSECPEMTLTLVGGNPEGVRDGLEEKVKSAGLSDKIKFINSIDYDDLHEFVKDYHVFIHPSCHAEDGDCEGGAPVVFLDVQATGMPVISTKHCDIPAEVIDGKTGLLVEEKDSSQLAEAIKRFYMMKQEEYDSFSESAGQHVRTNYDIKKSGREMGKIYSDLIRKKSG